LSGQDASEVTAVRQLAFCDKRHNDGLDPDKQRHDAAGGEQGECGAVAGAGCRELDQREDQTCRGDQRDVNREVHL